MIYIIFSLFTVKIIVSTSKIQSVRKFMGHKTRWEQTFTINVGVVFWQSCKRQAKVGNDAFAQ